MAVRMGLACGVLAASLAGVAHSMPNSSAATARLLPVQWSAPLNAGITPEQLLFALRKRELGAHNPASCNALGHEVQRLQRSLRKAAPEQQAQAQTDLSHALQRQAALRCPAGKKL